MVGAAVNGSSAVLDPFNWGESTMHEEETTLGAEAEVTLGEMARTMIRVERKLDDHERKLQDAMATIERRFEQATANISHEFEAARTDHEKRLRTLESWMWRSIGAGAAAGGAVSAIIALAVKG